VAYCRSWVGADSQIIFIEQLIPMLGLQSILNHPENLQEPPSTPIAKLLFVIEHFEHISKITTILSFVSLAVLIAIRIIKQHAVQRPGGRWMRYVPEILLVVVGTTGES
jgi:MFS superfamily sulfate permease-like transporter